MHNFGIAWDMTIFDDEGNDLDEDPGYAVAGAIAKAQGLEWGGDWVGFEDEPHIQMKTGLTLQQMRDLVAEGKTVI
jgi:peptidoglycan L-alanyl-D-glutamate endopeptidase CwlK